MYEIKDNFNQITDEEMIAYHSYKGIKLNARYQEIVRTARCIQEDKVHAILKNDIMLEKQLTEYEKALDNQALDCLQLIQEHNKVMKVLEKKI